MTDTPPEEVLGLPVVTDGYFDAGYRVPQRALDEFAPIFRAVLEEPAVACFGWVQYTPYFDDGSTCRFRASGLWAMTPEQYAKLVEERAPLSGDPWDDFDSDDFEIAYGKTAEETFGKRGYGEWVTDHEAGTREHVPGEYVGETPELYQKLRDLYDAVDGGAFDHVLLTAFGDHTHVRVNDGVISLTGYEHD